MNDQEQKPKNKKLLTYYLILGACILVIAAVAIAVTLTLTLGGSEDIADDDNTTIDADDDSNSDDDTDDTDNDTDDADTSDDEEDDGEDVATETTLLMPVASVNTINSYGFYHNTTLDKYYVHTGIDFAGEVGDEVYAVLDGTVTSIVLNSYLTGTTITISHDNGLVSVYSFVDAVDGLSVGDTVERGEVIATIAEATGREYKDGAHLHFEVYLNDAVVDPEDYLDISEK